MIYLDNSATSFPAPEVIRSAADAMIKFPGNPSSRHNLGLEAEKELESCRKRVAKVLGIEPKELCFTSGGTESDNIAVLGGANIKKGRRVVTTAVEHPAVLRSMKRLEELGFEVIYLVPGKDGSVSINDIGAAITPDTCLVSVMAVNNETGALMPIDKIKPILDRTAPRALLHTDAVQALGHIPVELKKWGVDMASFSGHKIHGPRGIGALYVKNGVTIKTPSLGGGQERGLRSGTENLPCIAGFVQAIELISPNDFELMAGLKERLRAGLLEIPGTVQNGEGGAPHILNISFSGIRSEVMLNAFSLRRIYVSSGSACARGAGSHVLKAMGAELSDNAIRFSISRYTDAAEIDKAIAAAKEIVSELRRN